MSFYVAAQRRLADLHDARRRFLTGLRQNRRGTVSWEYVLVAALVVVAVGTAFGPGATGAIETALVAGLGKVTAAFATFVP